jgi:Smr domain
LPVLIVNLEEGFPTREQALQKLTSAIARAKRDGITVLKIIHGYGSTGVGGILRPVIRSFLRQEKEAGSIALFVNGESFSSFDARSKALLAKATELLIDRDLGCNNKGVTFILL